MTNYSIIIFTKNEEHDLLECLKSSSFSDDIHVFDSGSSDKTISIAERFGARVWVRSYDDNSMAFGGNEAAHKNYAFKTVNFKHPWVFILDADERITSELNLAIIKSIESESSEVAFRVKRRDYFQGAWLKHVTPSPFNIRLVKPEYIKFERITNPITVVDGRVGEISAHFNHFPFSKGIAHWMDKHNKYSSYEAQQIILNKKLDYKLQLMKIFTSKDKSQRRFYQKELYYKLPFRPLIMFVLLYFLKRGFLDGKAGFLYALLRSMYEIMIVLKIAEIESPIEDN